MRKTIAILAFIYWWYLSPVSFAAINYSRSPSGSNITSPVNITVSLDSISDLNSGQPCTGATSWAFFVCKLGDCDRNNGRSTPSIPITSLSYSYNFNLSVGSYDAISYDCKDINGDNLNSDYFEGDETNTIFDIYENVIVSGMNVIIPANMGVDIGSNVGNQLADYGTLKLLGVIMGIPLAFYSIRKVINLIPKDKVSERADRAMKKTDTLLK